MVDKNDFSRTLRCVIETKDIGYSIKEMKDAIDERDLDKVIFRGVVVIRHLQAQVDCGFEGASEHIANITMAMRMAAEGHWDEGAESAAYYLGIVAEAYHISPGIPPFRFD